MDGLKAPNRPDTPPTQEYLEVKMYFSGLLIRTMNNFWRPVPPSNLLCFFFSQFCDISSAIKVKDNALQWQKQGRVHLIRRRRGGCLPILLFLFEPSPRAAKSLPKWETFEFDLALLPPPLYLLVTDHSLLTPIGLCISHCIPWKFMMSTDDHFSWSFQICQLWDLQ